jgi:ATPase subunit of ABC transporter with duplicated ATPase domains
MMITVSDVTKGYGGRVLFEDVNVAFSPGNNYGLTGPNGAGKSTFMKLLIGAEETDKGHVSLPERTAWLRQDHFAYDDHRVIDVAIMGNTRLWAALDERERLYAKEELTDADGERLGELEMVVMEEDGYTAEPEAAQLLDGLGVEESLHDKRLGDLTPGLKVRVMVAQALFGKPDALLLDEPTNHLDLESIRWLEDFLLSYRGVLVVISHDRRFLNAVCDQIADIDYHTIITYPGNYDEMVRQKAQIHTRQEKQSGDRTKKIEQLQGFIQRFGAGSRASQTRSRQKQIEKLRPDEIKRSNISRPFINFEVGEPSGRDVLSVEPISKAFGDQVIFENFGTHLSRGDKVAVIGRNGVGKTTLVKTVLEAVDLHDGPIRWGHNTSIGYFGHDHRDQIGSGSTVYDWLFSQRPEVGEQQVRAVLGRMLFSGADGGKPTGTLSGGEGARLVLCKLILMDYNTLILDEPTDHLDLESISALADSIDRYQGTLIYVTHDRELASRASRVWAYPEPGTLIDYGGTIDEYLQWFDREKKSKTAS